MSEENKNVGGSTKAVGGREIFRRQIWSCKKTEFVKKISRLNRILAKHGKAPYVYRFEDEHHKPVTFTEHIKGDAFAHDTERKCMVLVCTAVVEGEIYIKKNDKNYRYIGSVRYDGGVKQSYCNDKDFEWAFLNFREGVCDHCGTKRTDRKSYFLFETDGKVLQVGSTCLKEYLGIDAKEYLTCAENTFLSVSYGEEDFFGAGGAAFSDYYGMSYESIYGLLDFATMGFQKWRKASDGVDEQYAESIHDLGTVEIVRIQINNYFRGKKVMYGNNPVQLTRQECIAYWEKQPLTTFTDNILNALQAVAVTKRTLGTYCYGIYGAVNAAVKAQMGDAENGAKPCKYEVGKRVNVKGKVLTIKEYEVDNFAFTGRSGFVTMYSVNFQDEDDALYHFKTSSTTFQGVEAGDLLELRGKILEAREWKGVAYTGLHIPKARSR